MESSPRRQGNGQRHAGANQPIHSQGRSRPLRTVPNSSAAALPCCGYEYGSPRDLPMAVVVQILTRRRWVIPWAQANVIWASSPITDRSSIIVIPSRYRRIMENLLFLPDGFSFNMAPPPAKCGKSILPE